MPFLAHATMEPMNATAHVTPSGCEIWAPTQGPGYAQAALAGILELKPEQIKIHTTYLGGGFGRRAKSDFIVQAALISKAVGKPVKLIWSREEDMQHDFYRPASAARLRAGLDSNGKLTGWDVKIVSPGRPAYIADGANASPYAPKDRRLQCIPKDIGVPWGAWRSIGNSSNGFYIEGFVDELAYAAGQDPYLFRCNLLSDKPRHRAVLEKVAAVSGWSNSLPSGQFHGIAMHAMVGTIVAHVVQISMEENKLRIHRVDCAVDCGIAINPDTITAQMEGSIMDGLTAAIYGEITIKHGRVEQSNFGDYRMMRLPQTPKITVSIMEGADEPGGVGEPGVPPTAPALANAIFAATGRRIRSLPLVKNGIDIA